MVVEAGQGAELPGQAALTPDELRAATRAATGRTLRSPVSRVTAIAYDWGSPATAGLWRVDVHDGDRGSAPACSFFVKLLRHGRLWPGLAFLPSDTERADFVGYFPWRAELDMFACGIGSVLPPGMRTPRLHHVKHADADHVALWWEFVPEREASWELADYERAAYLLGRLAARRREGAAINQALPSIARDRTHGSALRYYTERRVLRGALPMLAGGSIWHHPVVASALHAVGDPGLPDALTALGQRLPQVLDLLDALPQAHPHGDASPQNLLLPAAEPGMVVPIDWGFGTLLPVGFDLGQLLTGLASAGLTDPDGLAAIDAVLVPAYRTGLSDEGWQPPADAVRAGYLGGLAARSALCTLPVELLGPGAPAAAMTELFAARLRLARVLIDLTAPVTG
jgi:hypothetical protein